MKLLEFEDGAKMFSCQAASSPGTPGTDWWWISVTGEKQRYAGFRTEATDTPLNLRPRVLAYYAQMVADRDRPREVRPHWSMRRAAQAKTDATPAIDAPVPDVVVGQE